MFASPRQSNTETTRSGNPGRPHRTQEVGAAWKEV